MQPILTPDPDAKVHPDEDYDKTESLIEIKKGKRIDNSRNKDKQKITVSQIIVIAAVLICIVVIGFFVFTRPVPVKDISGIEDVIALEVGQVAQVTPQVEPKRAAGVKLVFSSEYPSIVSVDPFGVLQARNNGVSRITIDAKGFTKVFTVIVSGEPKTNEEWRNEGYEDTPPFREFERLYQDGFPTDMLRYTGKIKSEDTTDFAVTEPETTTVQPTTVTTVTTVVESTTTETTDSETTTSETAAEITSDAETSVQTTAQTTEATATATTASRATSSQSAETRPVTTTTSTARQTTRTTTQRTTTRATTTRPVTTVPTTEVKSPQTETTRQPATTQQEITVPRRDRSNKPPDLENEFIER